MLLINIHQRIAFIIKNIICAQPVIFSSEEKLIFILSSHLLFEKILISIL